MDEDLSQLIGQVTDVAVLEILRRRYLQHQYHVSPIDNKQLPTLSAGIAIVA